MVELMVVFLRAVCYLLSYGKGCTKYGYQPISSCLRGDSGRSAALGSSCLPPMAPGCPTGGLRWPHRNTAFKVIV